MKFSGKLTVLSCCIFLLQLCVDTSKADPASVATVVGAVFAGASLAQTTIDGMTQNSETNRCVAIGIENYHLDLELVAPRWYHDSGTDQYPPAPAVSPGFKEGCLFRKASVSATGACGVLNYRIDKVSKVGDVITRNLSYEHEYINIMYCSPWSGSTSFAVEVTQNNDDVNEELFDWIYQLRITGGQSKEFRKTILGSNVNIIAVMSDASKATLTIRIQ